jgi:hypothetical protein
MKRHSPGAEALVKMCVHVPLFDEATLIRARHTRLMPFRKPPISNNFLLILLQHTWSKHPDATCVA